MKRRTKLVTMVALVASAVTLAATSAPAQANSVPSGPLFTFPKQPRPDLTVSSIVTTWTRFTVANVGNAPAGPFTVAVGPRYGPGCRQGWFVPIIWTAVRMNGLAAGGSVQVEVDVSPWARYIAVDIDQEVLELGESSDERTLAVAGNNVAFLPGQLYPCPS